MFRFVLKLKNRQLHIKQILTFVLLWVFSLAITPWGSLHHHEEIQASVAEKHCTHKLHLKTEQETCLICKAHFEKNYILSESVFVTYLKIRVLALPTADVTSAYAALISTSLRGPPALA